ncbi:MAG: hypothetical protein IPL03_01195 [Sterolibacteriaceae bacterium]|nr:hypothetical protein [Candidatus Methylophosphatis haderslevensis]
MRPVLAVVFSSLAMFSLAGLYTGVLAREFISANVDAALLRMPPNLGLVFAGYVLLAAAMTALYRRFGPFHHSPVISGAKFGTAIGVLWLMPYSLVLFGVYRFPYHALPLDFAWAIVEQGIGGCIIAQVLSLRRKDR